MSGTDYPSYIFAVLVLVGTTFGYLKSGSPQPLIVGIVFFSLLTYGASRSSANSRDVGVLMVSSLLLAAIMAIRFYTAGYFKFMPGGLVMFLSLASFIRNLLIYTQA